MTKQFRVAIAVPAEVEPSVAVGLFDAFWAAGVLWNRIMGEREQPRFAAELVGLSRNPVTTGTGVKLVPDCTFAEEACRRYYCRAHRADLRRAASLAARIRP